MVLPWNCLVLCLLALSSARSHSEALAPVNKQTVAFSSGSRIFHREHTLFFRTAWTFYLVRSRVGGSGGSGRGRAD